MALSCRSKALLLFLPCLVACTPASQPTAEQRSGQDCFNVSQLTGYETLSENRIRVRAGVVDEYDIQLSGGQCNTVEWTQALAIESTPSSWICTGKNLAQGNIYFREPTTRRRVQCFIEDVQRAMKEPPHR